MPFPFLLLSFSSRRSQQSTITTTKRYIKKNLRQSENQMQRPLAGWNTFTLPSTGLYIVIAVRLVFYTSKQCLCSSLSFSLCLPTRVTLSSFSCLSLRRQTDGIEHSDTRRTVPILMVGPIIVFETVSLLVIILTCVPYTEYLYDRECALHGRIVCIYTYT